jgi:L-ascorbate metabolism protein UlaG (beta-lactamase superfamily)
MDSDLVYLRHNAVIEPFIDQWYAWAYLMPPPSAAMFLANTQLPLLRSFVEAPEVHVSALSNPDMRGGPFIDLPVSRAPEVRALLERTEKSGAALLELADAIKSLEHTLAEEAKGASLDELYRKVPEPLRGYVELVYDMQDRATIRYFERLLYKSRYHDPSRQSFVLSLVNPDERHFRLSTPRMLDEGELAFQMPFASKRLDGIYESRYRARSFGELRELFGMTGKDAERLRTFFTEEPPKARTPYEGDGVRVRYFGHASILVEAPGVTLFIDPMFSYDVKGGPERFSHAHIPEVIDYVVISHNHQDHVLFETLLELRHRVRHVLVPRSKADTLIDPSLKLIFEQLGFPSVRELGEMDRVDLPGGYLQAIPFLGEHGDLDIRTKMGMFIELAGKRVFTVVDSNNIEPRLYEHVHRVTGGAEVLFVGMECEGAPMSWLYGPLFTKPILRKNDHSRRFDGSDCDKAMRIVDLFKPREVYIYAMGMEPWLGHVAALHYTEASRPIVQSNATVARCAERGVIGERLALRKEVWP